ncbi:MAG TPA: hypothetical protein VJI98_03530 [Candidatus Nanoarchaeia archaeon]|nr:hypothetical protein [Candidatus Nanoarchaeia archaeon]
MVIYLGILGIKEGINWSGTTVPMMIEVEGCNVNVSALSDYKAGSLEERSHELLAYRGDEFSARSLRDDGNLANELCRSLVDVTPQPCRLSNGKVDLVGYLLVKIIEGE